MDDVYKNIEEYNANKKRKILIVLCLIIKQFNQVVKELIIRDSKLNISLVFITQSYFAVPKNIRLSSTRYFIMKYPKKREL